MNNLVSMWIEKGYIIINDEAKTHNSQIYILAKDCDIVMIQDFGKDGASAYTQHHTDYREIKDKLHKRNVQLADLKNKLLKTQDKVIRLEEEIKRLNNVTQSAVHLDCTDPEGLADSLKHYDR